jgi:hypothetical protein
MLLQDIEDEGPNIGDPDGTRSAALVDWDSTADYFCRLAARRAALNAPRPPIGECRDAW